MVTEFVELCELITSFGFDIEIKNKYDIFIIDKNFIVSYCNFDYYCSIVDDKDRKYNFNKMKEYNDVGFNVIIIFEDEYVFHKDIVVNRLKHILGINNAKKMYARNCTLVEVPFRVVKEFYNHYHIQGMGQSGKVHVGAFVGDDVFTSELVAAMSFGKLSRAKGNLKRPEYSWELLRFCSHSYYRIVGVASRLLTYFENNYKWESILSFADRRWSLEGGLYKNLGFELLTISQPNYYYIHLPDIRRKHRFAYRRDVLRDMARGESKLPEEKIITMSELDLAQYFGVRRIFDCGNYKFIKQKQN